jgi:hypothetical protein
MPSVNLARLRLEAYALAGLLIEPGSFQSNLRALLDEYSHRLLRRGRSMAQRSALPAWDVPGLLLRELKAALLPAAEKNPEAALTTATVIWSSGKLEEKQLAAYLAGRSRNPGLLRTLLHSWVKETEDPVALQDLARLACLPLRNSNGLLFRHDIRGWMEDPAPSQRRFGWMALHAWVEEKTSAATFAAFELLSIVFAETDPEAVQIASDLLVDLSQYSPQETQGWLAELNSKSLRQGRRFFRLALPRLPEEVAAVLRDLQGKD